MNREIKFRGWDSVHNRMIYSDKHLGFRPFEDNNSFDNYDFNISKKGVYCLAYDEYDDDFGGGVCNETDLPIMEYVGLKDKNGVEIYEGDLILIGEKRRKVEVIFKDGSFGYLYNGVCIPFQNQNPEVIGNIYKNEVD